MFLLAAVILVLGAVAWGALSHRLEANEWSEDANLGLAIASAPPGLQAELAAGAGREALVVGEGNTEIIVAEVLPDTARIRWSDRVGERARRTGTSQFTSADPSGTSWWITSSEQPDGCCLVIQRRASAAMSSVNAARAWMAGLGASLLIGLTLLYLALTRRVQKSTQALLDASEDLRLRGEIRASVRHRLDRVPNRPLEFKRLAHSIDSIERDARRSFDQVESLLRAAGALGRSLDLDVVLQNTLVQLEQVLGAPQSTILGWDQHLGRFVVLATRGHNDDYLRAITGRETDSSLPSMIAMKELVPVQVPDTESEIVASGLRDRGKTHGYRSVLAVPLPPAGDRSTVLVLHKPEPYTYSHDEIALSISFAGLAAAAIRNAELFSRIDQDLQQTSRELGAIVESVEQGILVESAAGRVIYANSTMIDLLPIDALFVEGMSADDFLEMVFRSAVDPIGAHRAVRAIRNTDDHWTEIDLLGRDGALSTLRVRAFSVSDALGQRLGEGQVWTDVTDDRALDRMKSGLLATVSHEFRTPLALIKGYATTLLADDVEWPASDRAEFLQMVASEADRLTELVQKLLDMRRIDADMVELQCLPVEVEEIVEAAVKGVSQYESRLVIGPITDRVIPADRTRAVTALRNLISNACVYSPSDSVVNITADVAGDVIELKVTDQGIGVPDQLKARIFGTFVRADDSITAERRGVGLGLAIARGFVEAHGGNIWVEDRTGGPGSVFCMTLPLSASAESSRRNSPDLDPRGAIH